MKDMVSHADALAYLEYAESPLATSDRSQMMITLNVFFDVKQDHEADFIKLLNHMVVESNKEDGCSYYQLWRSSVDPYHYSLIEHWENQEKLNAHGRTEHWINFNDTVNQYLKTNYDEHHYTEIPA